jgi:hypothetical protein
MQADTNSRAYSYDRRGQILRCIETYRAVVSTETDSALPDSLSSRPNLSSANHRNGQIASYFQGVAAVVFKADRIRVSCHGVVSGAAIPFARTIRANSPHNDQPDQRTLSLGWVWIVDVRFVLTVFRVFLAKGRNFTVQLLAVFKDFDLGIFIFPHTNRRRSCSCPDTQRCRYREQEEKWIYYDRFPVSSCHSCCQSSFPFGEKNLLSSQGGREKSMSRSAGG